MYNSIERKVYKFIEENELIVFGEHVIVGISGGADSTCLLHVLNRLASMIGCKITAVHINHMIRGDEALRDERHAINFCSKLNIDIMVDRIDVIKLAKEKKISTEEAGRLARYDTFYRYKQELCADKIAVAHNKNDNVETVLMNIIRGSGLEGLKGIDSKRDVIVRPLLGLTREEIENYCRDEKLEYVTDSTNCETIYTRNKVRLKLLRYIDDIFDTDIVSKVDRMSHIVNEDNNFIESMVDLALVECVKEKSESSIIFDIDSLRTLHKSIQRRVLRRALLYVNKANNRIEYKHIEDMVRLMQVNKTGLKLDLPYKTKVYRDYGILKVYKEKEKECVIEKDVDISISCVGDIKVNDSLKLEVEVLDADTKIDSSDVYTKYFDYDILLENDLKLRKRRNGDKFRPINSNGTKKLKKYFIDKKISKPRRNSMYLLAKGDEIIWIIGDNVSDKFKITKKSEKIVRFSLASMI